MSATPQELTTSFAAALSELAQQLFAVDSSTDTMFVRSQAAAGNPSAATLAAQLDEAWDRYSRCKASTEALEDATKHHRSGDIDSLLGPAGTTLPDGSSIALADGLSALRAQIANVGSAIARMADDARATLTRLAAAEAEVRDLRSRAAALGAEDAVGAADLVALLERTATACAADPTSTAGLEEISARLVLARNQVETLEADHAELPSRLDAARTELADITRLVSEGQTAYTASHSRIAAPTGLLEPLTLESGDHSLSHWLQRIEAEAATGRWAVASKGLASWRTVADRWLHRAREVATANGQLLRKRNDLRGLLDAYRAKAAGTGFAEDSELARAGEQAHEALFEAPCDLVQAERLVHEYISRVNQGARR